MTTIGQLDVKATPDGTDYVHITTDLHPLGVDMITPIVAFTQALDAAVIKTLYESNGNTNAFTDALLGKLNGIETGANDYAHPGHTGEVTSVGDGAMTITPGAVTTSKIADGAVSEEKIADGAVGNAELAPMPAETLKLRTGTGGPPTDTPIDALSSVAAAYTTLLLAQLPGSVLGHVTIGDLPFVTSDPALAGGGTPLPNMVEITQAAYEALSPPDDGTFYAIVG